MDQIGAVAGKQYQGDGLSVAATPEGARLRCVFQKLEGEATPEGLWLTSITDTAYGERFRVVAVEVGREASSVRSGMSIATAPPPDQAPSGAAWHERRMSSVEYGIEPAGAPSTLCIPHSALPIWQVPLLTELEKTVSGPACYKHDAPNGAVGSVRSEGQPLPRVGTVSVAGQVARFIRPGLTEEYSVSMDGIRQDFLIERPPLNPQPSTLNQLRVELEVTGARVEPLARGARLVLTGSGRKIAYSRLRATDARGQELPARMVAQGDADAGRDSVLDCGSPLPLSHGPEVTESGRGLPQSKTLRSAGRLAVLVDDSGAEYPVRIDPTFSDENWVSLNPSIPGTDGSVSAAVVDGAGNLYIGGYFTVAGDVIANNIARWNGSSWSPLGSGLSGGDPDTRVYALAVSGSDVYAGGNFTTAGGSPADYIAKWNGSSWSALGSGLSGGDPYTGVEALAVSGSDVCAGGNFTTAGGSPANYIAKWNGSSWSALGSGMNGGVSALAVSGSDVYAGGSFTTAGGNAATNIAKWNGSSWSGLGSGMNGGVSALAVSGSDVYAGGSFTTAGGSAANHIAKWNGTSWSALGSGMDGLCVCAGGVGQRPVCGRQFHDGGGQRGQPHCQMEREQLVGPGVGDGRWGVGAGGVGQ